jgi:micrococcal nuclease
VSALHAPRRRDPTSGPRVLSRALLGLILLCGAAVAHARSFEAVVTHVVDGDSLWVRPARGGPPQEVRLHGIDAPEGCQAHGAAARDALRQRLLQQPVTVEPRARDDYRRTVARLRHRGDDVGEWLVRRGHAWSQRYRRSPGPYAEPETLARGARQGLWADARAIEPRQFRRAHGPCPRS